MNSRQGRTLQAFRRVQNWLAARPELTNATPALAGHAAALDRAVESATSLAADQALRRRSALGATATARALRADLLNRHIRPLATLAKLALPDVARATEALRRPSRKSDAERLLVAANAMAAASEPYAEVLVQSGLPRDFAAQLKNAATAYRKAIDAGGEARGAWRGDTAGLLEVFDEGKKAVATMTVLLQRRLEHEPQALAEWQQLSRVTLKGAQPAAPPAAPSSAAIDTEAAPVAVALQKAA